MCGIYALIDFAKPVNDHDLAVAKRVDQQLAPRGPDSSGQWISPCNQVLLGHRRLAIIDLSPTGYQPMHDVTGRYSIVFNGEIFNYRALREELKSGFEFRTHSDTETIIAAWQRWGADCLGKFRGMFAFVLWDRELRQVHVARDAFGIKPLYIRQHGEQLWIASQVKALTLVAPGLTENNAAKAGYFLWGSVPDPFTPFNEIVALQSGHVITYEFGKSTQLQSRDWFKFSETFAEAAEVTVPANTNVQEELRALMLDTVNVHREADVPVGVFLSAGRDSTTLAALSCELTDSEHAIQTVTLAFKEYIGTENDESVLAESVAHELGTKHSTVQISKADFSAELGNIFIAMDQPSYDGVNTYFVSKATHEAGLKVALSGLGGDELFGGYPSFTQVPSLAEATPEWMQYPGMLMRQMFSGVLAGMGRPKLAGMLEYSGSYERAYQLRRGLFMPWELDQVMSRADAVDALIKLATLPALSAIHKTTDHAQTKISLLEAAWFMRHQLLRDSDWASMAHGLELRVPLVDVHLWKKVLPLCRLPASANGPADKRMMSLTPKHRLPDSIIDRPKTGFSIPVSQWLLEADGGDGPTSQSSLRPWAMRVWERWMESVPR
ncbi:asparagine synthase (glutamine-hydrolyzing) [Oxalobacteraceae bacterium GrIS 2.11]